MSQAMFQEAANTYVGENGNVVMGEALAVGQGAVYFAAKSEQDPELGLAVQTGMGELAA